MDFCPNPECSNKNSVPEKWPNQFYSRYGERPGRLQRYLCKICGKTFSSKNTKATYRQRLPEKNPIIYRLLVNNRSIRQICNEANVSPVTVYRKIEFISKRLLCFEKLAMSEVDFIFKKNQFYTNYFGNIEICIDIDSGYVFRFRKLTGIADYSPNGGIFYSEELPGSVRRFIEFARKRIRWYMEIQKRPNAYKVENVEYIFNTFRVHYNFIVRSKNCKTPALAIGLRYSPDDLLKFLK